MWALSPGRQSAAMPCAAVRADIHQALDVHGDFRAKGAFDAIVALDDLAQTIDVCVRQVLDARIRTDARLGQDAPRHGLPDPVDVLQPNLNAPLARDRQSVV